jgi:hypothetical protein
MANRLIEYNLERLKKKQLEARLDAINELRLLGSSEALAALEQVYRNDPEPEARQAAQQAGLEIFLKNRQSNLSSPPSANRS